MEAFAHEDEIRRKLRRSQLANSLVMLVIVVGILIAAAFFIVRLDAWHLPPRAKSEPSKMVVAPAPAAPVSQTRATPAAATPAVNQAPAFVDPRAKPSPPRAEAPKPTKPEVAAAPPPPQVRLGPSEPTGVNGVATAEPAPMERPSGGAAKQKLNSIKCYDQFAFDREAGGRRYFSALCLGGNRMQVSCIGAGCKIEYAPAPSHVPDG